MARLMKRSVCLNSPTAITSDAPFNPTSPCRWFTHFESKRVAPPNLEKGQRQREAILSCTSRNSLDRSNGLIADG